MRKSARPIRSTLKDSVKKALVRSGALDFAVRASAPPAAVILMYHSIVEDPRLTEDTIGISQARSKFEAQIRTVAKEFNPVTVEQVAQFAKGGKQLPPKAVAVTFDDGFFDNYDVALPILNRYGIPATFYIMVDAVETGVPPWYCRLNFAFHATRRTDWIEPEYGRRYSIETVADREAALKAAWDAGARKVGRSQAEFVRRVEESLCVASVGAESRLMLRWEEVRALSKAGHTIGAHTISHPNLAHVSEEEAQSEIVGCKKRLEEEVAEPIDHFSYPHPALNPQWTPNTLRITREAGFRSAVLTSCGPVRRGDEPLSMKRIYAADDLDQWIWNLQCTFLGRSI
jgi:peptidoglycan/xylan/chitin deacetylase (PgdA/CDA1 family)